MANQEPITHWIYPLRERSNYYFEDRGQRLPASVEGFYELHGRGGPCTWGLSHGFRLIQPGDFVWAYFGGKDRIIVGVGVVTSEAMYYEDWDRHKVSIEWDAALTQRLRDRPIHYAEYEQHVQSAAARANENTRRVLERWLGQKGAASGAKHAKEVAFTLREIRTRTGQQAFRDEVLQHFGKRCAITGCRTVSVLEAAHIVPVAVGGTHDVVNALLLRADIHRLFDDGLLTIDPKTFEVSIASSVRDRQYTRLRGNVVEIPKQKLKVREGLRKRAEVVRSECSGNEFA